MYKHLSNIFGNERVLITREPGGWSGGSQLRDILLHSDWRPWSEFFLFMADRCEHVEEQIKPALAKGQIVICERYIDSTLAYQGWGKGLPLGR
ncbi:MAG: dTMP kinase [Acetomicrobium sp.]